MKLGKKYMYGLLLVLISSLAIGSNAIITISSCGMPSTVKSCCQEKNSNKKCCKEIQFKIDREDAFQGATHAFKFEAIEDLPSTSFVDELIFVFHTLQLYQNNYFVDLNAPPERIIYSQWLC